MPEPLDPEPAIAALDRLLADKPDQITHDFSATTRKLTAYHDAMVRRLREGALPPSAQAQLQRLNAVISVVYACHYPLRAAQWDVLEQARGEFHDLSETVSRSLRHAD
ncbi:MAG TPA: hypothetical protein VHS58_07170 [Acetobacteraceae bacterium]|jgi:hypothetical protein|nr:hypothetical protein [Acetobacteraceae bacterium]